MSSCLGGRLNRCPVPWRSADRPSLDRRQLAFAKMENTKRPFGVLVSTPSWMETNSMPIALNSSSAFTRCRRLPASRSSLKTTTASNRRLRASTIIRSSCGRLSFAPEIRHRRTRQRVAIHDAKRTRAVGWLDLGVLPFFLVLKVLKPAVDRHAERCRICPVKSYVRESSR